MFFYLLVPKQASADGRIPGHFTNSGHMTVSLNTESGGKKSNYGQGSVLSLRTAHHKAIAGQDLLRSMVKPTPQSQASGKCC